MWPRGRQAPALMILWGTRGLKDQSLLRHRCVMWVIIVIILFCLCFPTHAYLLKDYVHLMDHIYLSYLRGWMLQNPSTGHWFSHDHHHSIYIFYFLSLFFFLLIAPHASFCIYLSIHLYLNLYLFISQHQQA